RKGRDAPEGCRALSGKRWMLLLAPAHRATGRLAALSGLCTTAAKRDPVDKCALAHCRGCSTEFACGLSRGKPLAGERCEFAQFRSGPEFTIPGGRRGGSSSERAFRIRSLECASCG